jgi:1-acyl-sn-glycerol-3-phosphate acyltransferase
VSYLRSDVYAPKGTTSALKIPWSVRLRAQINRPVVALCLLVGLPLVAVTESIAPGRGRRMAIRCIRALGRLCGVTFEVRPTGRLDGDGSYVFVANHSSPLDIAAVLLADDRVQFLAAAGLFRVPLLSSAMRALGTRPIDRHDTGHAYTQLAELAGEDRPLRLAVFAEGGIAPAGRRLPFKKGAFVLAVDAGASVVPVAIHHTDRLLPPGARLGLRPGMVVVDLLPPVPTAGLTGADVDDLRRQVEAAVLSELGPADPT